jgi:hypothetical protein
MYSVGDELDRICYSPWHCRILLGQPVDGNKLPMIAKKRKGEFDTYFFVIDNFVKHANAKGYNRHVVTGAMQPGELLSVGQEALGLLLLENYWEPWKQLVEYMKQGMSTA